MHVIIAPDSFKGSAPAPEVASALAQGWASVRPDDTVRLLPMADGGEGTLDAFEVAVPEARRIPVTVTGPDSRNVNTHWLRLPPTQDAPGGTALVELACTSGITLLNPLQPLAAHTLGFGQAIAAALDAGASRLLLGIGGSSSTDGGLGMLIALGAQALDNAGNPVELGGGSLKDIDTLDLNGMRALPARGAGILCDVTRPLLGATGAAAVFAPQKGADAIQVALLERGLAHLAALTGGDPETLGAGAAGGTGFGLLRWGARMTAGSDAIGGALGLPEALATADIVITGEGAYDAQSAAGKVPSYVADLARASGTTALLVAGRIDTLTTGFAASLSLSIEAGGVDAALADPTRWLRHAGASLAGHFGDA